MLFKNCPLLLLIYMINIIEGLSDYGFILVKFISNPSSNYEEKSDGRMSFKTNTNEKTIEIHFNAEVLDFSNFFKDIFGEDNSIESIDLSNFDIHRITNMIKMFANCQKLVEIKGLNNLDTTSVKNMNGMFFYCTSLKSLDLSNFDTSSVTDMNQMFNQCNSLKSLDLSKFNISSVTNMGLMFMDFYNFQSLDI